MICQNCINFKSIKKFITSNGTVEECDHCSLNDIALDEELVFKFIEQCLDSTLIPLNECNKLAGHFYYAHEDISTTSSYIEYLHDVFYRYDKKSEKLLLNVPETFLDMIDEYISDNEALGPFCAMDEANRYNDLSDESARWNKLVKRLNNQFRYINEPLIDSYERWLSPLKEGNKLNSKFLKKLPAGNQVYRARIFNNSSERNEIINSPYSQLGPAPCQFTTDQRMTPAGVSALYSALDRDTCLSEIRCNSGTHAISGAFEILHDLHILDLTSLKTAYSETYNDPFETGIDHIAAEFTHELYSHLIKPAKNEYKDTYRITQSFFEYLRSKHLDQIQGVQFPSVQRGEKGTNVVIFSEYSIVQNECGDIYSPYFQNGTKNYIQEFCLNLSSNTNLNQLLGKPILEFKENSLVEHIVKSITIEKEDRPIEKKE